MISASKQEFAEIRLPFSQNGGITEKVFSTHRETAMTVNYEKTDYDVRPWGFWEIMDIGDSYAVKKIIVQAGKVLSLQSHEHRDEHWIIAEGRAEVTLGETVTAAGPNTPFFIPAKTVHRIRNTGDSPLIFIEVQTGALLDESDITRYEDAYGRV